MMANLSAFDAFQVNDEGAEVDLVRIVGGKKHVLKAVLKDRPNQSYDKFTVENYKEGQTAEQRQELLNKALADHVVVSLGAGDEVMTDKGKIFNLLNDPKWYLLRQQILVVSQDVAAHKAEAVEAVKKN